MKLLELLAQELPKLGGWPSDCEKIEMSGMGKLFGSRFEYLFDGKIFPKTCDWKDGVVTREEYESALAASKQPEWDGEGLPPVGCECMVKGEIRDDNFYKCKILNHTIFRGIDCAVFQTDKTVSVCSAKYFRPIRTEAERKRQSTIDDITETIIYFYGNPKGAESYKLLAERIIEAIEINKIPGIKLEN